MVPRKAHKLHPLPKRSFQIPRGDFELLPWAEYGSRDQCTAPETNESGLVALLEHFFERLSGFLGAKVISREIQGRRLNIGVA